MQLRLAMLLYKMPALASYTPSGSTPLAVLLLLKRQASTMNQLPLSNFHRYRIASNMKTSAIGLFGCHGAKRHRQKRGGRWSHLKASCCTQQLRRGVQSLYTLKQTELFHSRGVQCQLLCEQPDPRIISKEGSHDPKQRALPRSMPVSSADLCSHCQRWTVVTLCRSCSQERVRLLHKQLRCATDSSTGRRFT